MTREKTHMTLPITLLVDDGSAVNPMYWLHPDRERVMLVPNTFTRDFADLCAAYNVRGKFSVLPMPSGLGRIDDKLAHVPQNHLRAFIKVVREHIAPRFDITPELLTHQAAFRIDGRGYHHLYEDEWGARASAEEMTDYLALAFRILKKVGLPANGATSPWAAGEHNELDYARAIADAQWRIHRRKRTWYFLHCLTPANARWPWIVWADAKTGREIVTVPATTDDHFWPTQNQTSQRASRRAALDGADKLLSQDGRRGDIRELFNQGMPIVILTHWQSLFAEGRASGLVGLETLFRRIDAVFGDSLEWMTCSTLARRARRQA